MSLSDWIPLDRPAGPYVLFGGALLATAGFVGLCAFVRCPDCMERIVWRSAHNKEKNPALAGLLTCTQCPLCG